MATNSYTLTTAWQQIANGACMVDVAQGQSARLHFGNAKPKANTKAYHQLSAEMGMSLSYDGEQHCYARADMQDVVTIVATTVDD